jgi:hypothetical protein
MALAVTEVVLANALIAATTAVIAATLWFSLQSCSCGSRCYCCGSPVVYATVALVLTAKHTALLWFSLLQLWFSLLKLHFALLRLWFSLLQLWFFLWFFLWFSLLELYSIMHDNEQECSNFQQFPSLCHLLQLKLVMQLSQYYTSEERWGGVAGLIGRGGCVRGEGCPVMMREPGVLGVFERLPEISSGSATP